MNPLDKEDPYLKQMLSDLKEAENQLRHAIANQSNPFADNGPERLKQCKENVERLHQKLSEYHKEALHES